MGATVGSEPAAPRVWRKQKKSRHPGDLSRRHRLIGNSAVAATTKRRWLPTDNAASHQFVVVVGKNKSFITGWRKTREPIDSARRIDTVLLEAVSLESEKLGPKINGGTDNSPPSELTTKVKYLCTRKSGASNSSAVSLVSECEPHVRLTPVFFLQNALSRSAAWERSHGKAAIFLWTLWTLLAPFDYCAKSALLST